MSQRRFEDVWKEQCYAARGVRERHGGVEALDYLVGEKLLRYAEAAETHPTFARALPQFVAEVRRIFSRGELSAYFELLEDSADEPNTVANAHELEEAGLLETPTQRRTRVEKLAPLRPLLLTAVLGTA